MPPELRKRKAPTVEPATAPPAKKAAATKKKGPVAKAVAKVKEVINPKATKTNGAKPAVATKIAVGDTLDLEGFGGEIETNDGVKTTLKKLVDESTAGVVLFTYPKALTSGCKRNTHSTSHIMFIFTFHANKSQQAPLRPASSGTHIHLSLPLVTPFMDYPKILQNQTLTSK